LINSTSTNMPTMACATYNDYKAHAMPKPQPIVF